MTVPESDDGPEHSDDCQECPVDMALVAHPYRRSLVTALCLTSPPLPLAVVADLITARETGGSPDRHRDRRLRIYMALYHDHLPALVEAGVVDYHQADDAVALGPLGKQLEPVVVRGPDDGTIARTVDEDGPDGETD